MSEFKLSEKRKEIKKMLIKCFPNKHYDFVFDLIEKQDNEFIRLLKENEDIGLLLNQVPHIYDKLMEIIDKLAGSNLTEIEGGKD